MEDSLGQFFEYVLVNTVQQLVGLLGIFFIFGSFLSFLANLTRNNYTRIFGERFNIYWTGWFGTPVHEIGHAVFCLLFGYRINRIQLFNPDPHSEVRGYVNYSYGGRGLYQRIGKLFVSAGPIIFGTFLIYLGVRFLVPNGEQLISEISYRARYFRDFSDLAAQIESLIGTSVKIVESFFTLENFSSIQFWIFLYLSLCITSNMELSPTDMEGVWPGVVTIIILFLLINFISILFNENLGPFIYNVIYHLNTLFLILMIYALSISAVNFIFSLVTRILLSHFVR